MSSCRSAARCSFSGRLAASAVNLRRNFQRIAVWLSLAGVFWIAGGLAQGETRLGLWAVALGIEVISPALYFWVPGLGRSSLQDWNVDGGHMAERCALFVIIALGESLLVSGATFATSAWSAPVGRRLCLDLPRRGGDVVALLRQGPGRRPPPHRARRRPGATCTHQLHLPAPADRRRHHPLRGGRRAGAGASGSCDATPAWS